MKWLDVSVTLALLPIMVALGFTGLAIVGSLAAPIAFEATFSAVQRGIMRPARETLFAVPLGTVWMALGLWLGYAQRERAAREPRDAPTEARL
jgi:hypothetical protein